MVTSTATRRRARLALPLFVLGLLALTAGPVAAEISRLRIAVFGQDPPKSFTNPSGELTGFDVETARALCRHLQIECELLPTDWSALLPGLEAREFDAAIASISMTDERRSRVDFTRAYYRSPARFVARAGRLESVDPESLRGMRLGVRRDTTFDRYATDNLEGVVTLHRYATQQDALLDLILGRIDLTLGDEITLREGFLEARQGSGYAFVGGPVDDRRWFGDGNGIAVVPGDVGVVQLLDRGVADLQAKGVLGRLAERWLGSADPVRPRVAEPGTGQD
jgi:ABC-type amino acid transport substrate-binding protein